MEQLCHPKWHLRGADGALGQARTKNGIRYQLTVRISDIRYRDIRYPYLKGAGHLLDINTHLNDIASRFNRVVACSDFFTPSCDIELEPR